MKNARLKRKLYVRKTSRSELKVMWNTDSLPTVGMYYCDALYIQCTKKGDINWEKNSVYSIDELFLRGNVVVVKSK